MDPSRLTTIPLFDGLPEEELQRVTTFAEEHTIPDGQVIVREGDFSDKLSFIEEGTVEVLRGGEPRAELGPGEVFGEAGVLGKTMRNADVVATSPLRVFTLTRWDVKRMPQLAERLSAQAAERA
jgi:CRP/FNR family transcriptional regulator, cyclic AMP receptor protein